MVQARPSPRPAAHRIRPAEKCDIPAVVGLWVELNRLHSELAPDFACPADPSQFAGHIGDAVSSGDSLVLVATLEGEVVASANPASMAFWTKLGFVPYLEKRALSLSAEPLPSQRGAGGGLRPGEVHT